MPCCDTFENCILELNDLKPETLAYLVHCKMSPDPVFKCEGWIYIESTIY